MKIYGVALGNGGKGKEERDSSCDNKLPHLKLGSKKSSAPGKISNLPRILRNYQEI